MRPTISGEHGAVERSVDVIEAFDFFDADELAQFAVIPCVLRAAAPLEQCAEKFQCIIWISQCALFEYFLGGSDGLQVWVSLLPLFDLLTEHLHEMV